MSDTESYAFRPEEFFPRDVFDLLSDLRVRDPVAAYKATQTRQPRKELAPEGKLLILGGDAPASGATRVGSAPLAGGDRWGHIARITRVLLGGAFDGVLCTPDVHEELCLTQQILRENGGAAFLDGKAFIASLNPGGIAGSAFETADPYTGFTVERARHVRCDGVRIRLRIDLDSPDGARALERCAQHVTEVNAAQMILVIECQPVRARADGTVEPIMDPELFARLVGVAAALGETSTRTWLCLPWFEGLETALAATSLPVLLGDGPNVTDAPTLLREVAAAFKAGRNVRGVLLGQRVLHCTDDDPLAVAAGVEAVVRRGVDPDAIIERLPGVRGKRMDPLIALLDGKTLRFEGGVQTASYTM